MSMITTKEARAMPCPFARVQGDAKPNGDINGNCRADKCMMWRWKSITVNDHRWQSAVVRETALIQSEHKGEKPLTEGAAQKRAVAKIGDDLDGYIIRNDSDRGFCGIAGKPA